MDLTKYKGMKGISSFTNILKERMSRVKVRKAVTLFPPTSDMSLLRKGLCPFCSRKLRLLQRRPLYICGRKTCPATLDRDLFKVSVEKMAQILTNNNGKYVKISK